jgi:hypothetical protein
MRERKSKSSQVVAHVLNCTLLHSVVVFGILGRGVGEVGLVEHL